MPRTPEKATTPNITSPGVGTSSLGSTPDLGFHIGEPTPETLPDEEEPEDPALPKLKCGRGTPGTQTPGLTSPMGKCLKDTVREKCILNPVDEPKRWLNYMRTKHPVELFWWEDLIEKKRGLL